MVSIYTTYAIGSTNSSVNTLIEPWAVPTELIWWSPTTEPLASDPTIGATNQELHWPMRTIKST